MEQNIKSSLMCLRILSMWEKPWQPTTKHVLSAFWSWCHSKAFCRLCSSPALSGISSGLKYICSYLHENLAIHFIKLRLQIQSVQLCFFSRCSHRPCSSFSIFQASETHTLGKGEHVFHINSKDIIEHHKDLNIVEMSRICVSSVWTLVWTNVSGALEHLSIIF